MFRSILLSFIAFLCLSVAGARDRAELLGLMLVHGWLATVFSH